MGGSIRIPKLVLSFVGHELYIQNLKLPEMMHLWTEKERPPQEIVTSVNSLLPQSVSKT